MFLSFLLVPSLLPYPATHPDSNETIDLTEGFDENAETSAPAFGYVVNDIIHIKGN